MRKKRLEMKIGASCKFFLGGTSSKGERGCFPGMNDEIDGYVEIGHKARIVFVSDLTTESSQLIHNPVFKKYRPV